MFNSNTMDVNGYYWWRATRDIGEKMVKKIDDHIKKAFTELGFTEQEVKDGCWLLERKNKKTGEMFGVAWIALHKFLERVAQKAGIIFDDPKILNLEKNEIALLVNGKKGDFSAWAIGEAGELNLSAGSKNYRWAMAEKRAKDRVILKLLGVAGDMYSEEEADDFKDKDKHPELSKSSKITPHDPADNQMLLGNAEEELNKVKDKGELETLKAKLRVTAKCFKKTGDEKSLQLLTTMINSVEERIG